MLLICPCLEFFHMFKHLMESIWQFGPLFRCFTAPFVHHFYPNSQVRSRHLPNIRVNDFVGVSQSTVKGNRFGFHLDAARLETNSDSVPPSKFYQSYSPSLSEAIPESDRYDGVLHPYSTFLLMLG